MTPAEVFGIPNQQTRNAILISFITAIYTLQMIVLTALAFETRLLGETEFDRTAVMILSAFLVHSGVELTRVRGCRFPCGTSRRVRNAGAPRVNPRFRRFLLSHMALVCRGRNPSNAVRMCRIGRWSPSLVSAGRGSSQRGHLVRRVERR